MRVPTSSKSFAAVSVLLMVSQLTSALTPLGLAQPRPTTGPALSGNVPSAYCTSLLEHERQYDAEHPEASRATLPDPSATSSSLLPPPGFRNTVKRYLRLYRGTSPLLRGVMVTRIKDALFNTAERPFYLSGLKYIDCQLSQDSEAIYDLARALQLHWEARFATGWGETRLSRTRAGAQIGVMSGTALGIAAIGALMIARPQLAGRYFSLFRRMIPVGVQRLASGALATTTAQNAVQWGAPLLPLLGFGIGSVAGSQTVPSTSRLSASIPAAPAHVMHLGIASDDYAYDSDHVYNEILAATVSGVAVTYALNAIRAARYANAAATPAKLNPWVLLGSIALGVVVDYGAQAGVQHYEWSQFSGRELSARDQFLLGTRNHEPHSLFTGAAALVASAKNLAQWINRPILEASQSYADRLERAGGTRASSSEQDRLMNEFRTQVNEALTEQEGTPEDEDYQLIQLLGFLQERNLDSLNHLNSQERDRVTRISRNFEAWLARQEARSGSSASSDERVQLLAQYAGNFRRATERRVARELEAGNIPRHADHVLLQAASLLRTYPNEATESFSDELLSLVARNQLVIRAASLLGSPEHGAGTNPLTGGLQ